ncbi:MAG: helix-turn-helix transcriptional regulator [Bacteroidetes bacterium]|nr:helix-turn-helix transcriptional regulator [Bacteroidota bacterium]MBS1629837.1 helix-turn-helix transcriptional regulator [Bacteroidota bacterium]
MHIGENIAFIRKRKNIKQEDLAHRLGISQQALSKIENSY